MGSTLLIIFPLLLLVYGQTSCQAARDDASRIHVKGRWLVDDAGRVRIYHGFNSVETNFPWYPHTTAQIKLLNETQLALLEHWGFNVVRLGTMWSGAQPTEGSFNETYLSILSDIVNKLEGHGMMALLDMHQDVLTSVYGSYDGIPKWLVEKFPKPRHPYPWPFEKLHFWAQGYATEAVSQAFQSFYDNAASAQEYYAKFWQKIASEFNYEKHPNVLGYELINEPFAGDIYKDPSLALPGVTGKKNLQPMYHKINEAIRQVDPEGLIFYEPVTWSIMRNSSILGTGFDEVPGGPAYNNRSVLSWHYYCWYITSKNAYDNYTTVLRDLCDKQLAPHVFDSIMEDVHQIGGGSFLTEFASYASNGNPNAVTTIENDFVLGMADKYLQSWTYWDAGFFYANGSINPYVVQAFSRPYARAIAGFPQAMAFNKTTGDFEFHFTYSPSIKAPTEVFVSPVQYPAGFDLYLTSGFESSFNKTNNVLSITKSSKSALLDDRIEIRIKRKQGN